MHKTAMWLENPIQHVLSQADRFGVDGRLSERLSPGGHGGTRLVSGAAEWCDIEMAVVSPRLRASRCGVLGIANIPDIHDDLRSPPRSLSLRDTGTPF